MEALLTNIIFIQAIGFIAFGLGIWAFLSHDDARFKILLTCQCTFLCIHFGLLGAYGGMAAAFITGTRNIASLNANLKWMVPGYIILYLGLGAFFFRSWIDLLPITGSIISTIGLFYLKRVPMRLCSLFSTFLWIIHNGMVGSIGPFFMEIFIFLANIKTINSLRRKERAGPI
jgi:hypothetical protein